MRAHGIGTPGSKKAVPILYTADPDLREDPKSGTPNSGVQHPYDPSVRTLRWIHVLDPPTALGPRHP